MTERCREPLPAGENPTERTGSYIGRSCEQRFWQRVDTSGDCWLWTGPKRGLGYGSGPNGDYAHRFAYEHFVGPIPPGLFVLHHCDTPLCVKLEHLFLGTQDDNLKDAKRKGRIARGEGHYRAKLTEDAVREIRRLHAAGVTGLAARFGVSMQTIWRIATRTSWAWLS